MNRHKGVLSNQKGFTLVELAIVLVIIGLILGAVLKGQELINNAKLKRAYNQQREVAAAVYTYFDRYGHYPGDDNTAAARWSGVTDGNNNGIIDATLSFACTTAAVSETCQAWRHMRNANLITGDLNSAQSINNAYGGTMGVGTATIQTLATQWIGMAAVPFDACQILDLQYDDGVFNTGTIRGSGNYNTATTGTFSIYFKL
ncbi:MAG: prepilin-type N-terminal cleavage/methylation domain-containing protein [Deltaproteobacteria bacterium]|nr:prepilin-type N-terminal cleavage/methylation domain-containing protein [Deltaproteobacteria bacterium]